MTKFDRAMALVAEGDFASAKDVLEDLLLDDPRDSDALYNLGMCFSEIGEPEKALKPLAMCIEVTPDRVNAYVALGVARALLGDNTIAKGLFLDALRRDPRNNHAMRNLAAVLAKTGEMEKSLYYLHRAYEIDPSDPRTVYGLGHASETLNDPENAQRFYKEASNLISEPAIQDLARKSLNDMAARALRAEGPRMDSVFYMMKALDIFDHMSVDEIKRIAFEIGIKGESGLKINDPSVKYTLESLPGEFTGLQLISYMYVGFQKFDPSVGIGIDLSEEYSMALSLHQSDDILPC